MNIYVFKVEGIAPTECIGVIDSYKSFNFTKSFQDCGKWTLKGNFTPEARNLLQVGNLIYINPRVSGIIETVDISTDEKGASYVASGKELKGILDYRIVWDTFAQQNGIYEMARDIVMNNNKGNRKLFEVDTSKHIDSPSQSKQISYVSLLKAVSEIVKMGKSNAGNLIGFDVVCESGKPFTFKLIEGADYTANSPHPYILSRDFDNVSSLGYAESSKSKANIVKVGGEGEGADRKFATAGDESLSGFARREIFKDARNVQSRIKDESGETLLPSHAYQTLLQDEANALLKPDNEISVDAESVVDSNDALNLLGAKITLIDRAFGVRTDDYVSEINVIDESDGTLTTITVGKGLAAQKLTLPQEV